MRKLQSLSAMRLSGAALCTHAPQRQARGCRSLDTAAAAAAAQRRRLTYARAAADSGSSDAAAIVVKDADVADGSSSGIDGAQRGAPFDGSAAEGLLRSVAGVNAPARPQPAADDGAPLSDAAASGAVSASSISTSTTSSTTNTTTTTTTTRSTDGRAALRGIASLALPLAVQNLGGYSVSIIGQIAIGRLGPAMLGAAVLCNSVYNMTGLSLAMGLAAGLESLAGQAYGAGNFPRLGVLLQRAMLVCATVCAPVACLWLVSGPLLVAAGQEPAIAAEAARYLAACTPCLFLSVASECLRKFLQAQGEVRPAVAAAGASIAAAPLLFHLCVTRAGWGLLGAAAAFTACNAITLAVLVAAAALRARKLAAGPPEKRTWAGWSREAWAGWPEYLSYGVPAAAHICCEWIAFEAVILMAGMLPDAALALSATGLCLTLHAYLYMLPMAIGSSVNTRVAHALGAGDGGAAQAAARAALALVAAVQAGLVAVLLFGGRALVSVFCPDPAVVARCASTLPMLAALVALDGLNAACSGVLRGAGRQKLGAAVNVAGYWALGLPLAWALAFGAGMGERGLWVGLTAGAGLQAVVLLFLLARWDWGREAARVSKLAAAAA